MKKNGTRLMVLILTLSMLLSIPAFAASRASDQIDRYSVEVFATGNGKIAVDFSVDGTGRMNQVGAEEIDFYEAWGDNWIITEIWKSSDSGMMASNTNRFENKLYFDGISGMEYKVVVTVFAEDANGYDSRTETRYVTA